MQPALPYKVQYDKHGKSVMGFEDPFKNIYIQDITWRREDVNFIFE